MQPSKPGFADAQGISSALQQLQRLYGINPQVNMVSPTAGPYQWPGQAEVLSQGHSLDGMANGGVNLDMINQIYANHPGDRATADAIIQQAIKSDLGAAAPQALAPPGGSAPSFAQSLAGPGAMPPAAPSPSAPPPVPVPAPVAPTTPVPPPQVAPVQPMPAPSDPFGLSAPQGGQQAQSPFAQMQKPQGSAFAPTQGQNTGMGMAQLNQVVEELRRRGIQI